MQKNRRWFVLPLLIIMILPIICVPALAAGSGSPSDLRFSPLMWDGIVFGSNNMYLQEFAANFVSAGNQNIVTVDSYFCTQTIQYRGDNRFQYNLFADRSYRDFQFVAYDEFIDVTALDGYTMTLDDSENVRIRVDIAGHVSKFALVNKEWQAQQLYIYGQSSGGSVDFGDLFRKAVAQVTNDRYVLINDLTVVIHVDGPEEWFGGLEFYFNGSKSLVSSETYFNSFSLPYKPPDVIVDPANPNDVSFVDWLKVAVGGFLDFQLWPGFTLNQLIEFVVVIGLVLWFITLLI